MKPLPTQFTREGSTFTQKFREQDVAIFEQTREDCPTMVNYEVVVVQSHNGRHIHGKDYPPAEYYPSTGQWGQFGWTCTTWEAARNKALALLSRKSGPVAPKAERPLSSPSEEPKRGATPSPSGAVSALVPAQDVWNG